MAAIQPSVRRRRLWLKGRGRVWLLTAALTGMAVFVDLVWVVQLKPLPAPRSMPWWLLALLFFGGEVLVAHIYIRREAYSFGLGEIPLVLALFFATPIELILAQLLGIGAALVFQRRQSLVKVAFNLSHFALEAGVAAIIFYGFVEAQDPLSIGGWLTTLTAALATVMIGNVSVALAISLAEGRLEAKTLQQGLGPGVIVTVTNAALGLVTVGILWTRPQFAWLLTVPALTLFFAYRVYSSERERHQSVELLYQATRNLQESVDLDIVTSSLLAHARNMFRAEIAEILLLSSSGELTSYTGVGPEETSRNRPISFEPDGSWATLLSEGTTLLHRRPIHDGAVRKHLAQQGIRDLIATPLRADAGFSGIFIVANRLGEVSTFGELDVTLFETLANHASMALQKAQLVATLESSLAELTEVNRIKSDFVATVSHELRTPLTAVQASIKTINQRGTLLSAEQMQDLLHTADEQIDKLRQLIEDFLIVSRIESGPSTLTLNAVLIPQVISSLVRDLEPRPQGRSIKLEIDGDVPLVTTDESKVRLILANLLSNAIKYSPLGTTITVRTSLERGYVIVRVTDQGLGIPADEQERIFERFYQIDQSLTRRTGGVGLGLYICRALASLIGGEVRLEKSSVNGSTFSLAVPTQLDELPARLLPPGRRVM